jgi:hypothetical protein
MAMLYRLISQLNTSFTIEELQIHFSGKGSVCIVNKEAADNSKELSVRLSSRHVIKQPFHSAKSVTSPMGVWPFLKPKPEEPESKDDEVKKLKNEISGLNSKLDELVTLVKSGISIMSSRPNQTIQQIQPGSNTNSVPLIDEPKFIPSKIVPDEIKGNITVQEGEESREDLSSISSSLKNLRKKK